MSGRKVRKFDRRAMRGNVRLTPNDQPYAPPFTYECGAGHEVAASRAFTACPVFILGEACTAVLHRVGAGSGRGSNFARSA